MTALVDELETLLEEHDLFCFWGDDEWLDDELEDRFERMDEGDWSELTRRCAEQELSWRHKLVHAAGRLAPRDPALDLLDALRVLPGDHELQTDTNRFISDLISGERADEAFAIETEILGPGLKRFFVSRNGAPMPFSNAMLSLRHEWPFRAFLQHKLARCGFDAFFWETPPVTTQTFDRPFEYIVRDAPILSRPSANPAAFSEYFAGAKEAVTFRNLGRDAVLIAPVSEGVDYPHIGAFVRSARPNVKHALWRQVGAAMLDNIAESPLWLSTSGAGVPWLHVRIDSRPKYYTFADYRVA